MWELYYNFFSKFCDINKFEKFEMDTDSLSLALADEESDECILPASEQIGLKSEARTVETISEQMRKTTFSPLLAALNIRNKREPGLFEEEYSCTEMLCLCIKTYCCYDIECQKHKSSSKALNK